MITHFFISIKCVYLYQYKSKPPLPLGGAFLNYTYLSVKQIVTKVFVELVTPVPPKTIAF